MRLALVRNVGLSMLALGVFAVAGCNNNPIDYDTKKTTAIQIVPTTMVLGAGRSEQIQVTPINQGFEPTGVADVAFSIISCGVGGAEIAVVPDTEQQLPILPPMSRWRINAAATIGQTCVVWASQGIQDTMLITVMPEGISVVSAPQILRSGESSTIVLNLVDADGNVIAALDNTELAWSSDDSGILPVDAGNVGPAASPGTAVITAVWTGTEETATAGLGVSRQADITIPVVAEIPASADFDPAVVMAGSFGAIANDQLISGQVFAYDQFQNVNNLSAEVTDFALTSSNTGIADVSFERVVDPDNPLFVTLNFLVTTVGAGQATISGTVTTTSGVFPVSATIDVLAPVMTALVADNGNAADIVTITGSGFIATGFQTTVTVGGGLLGAFSVDSDTQITATMPSYAAAGARTVIVDVGGVMSNGLSWNQNGPYSEPGTENNDPSAGGTVAPLSLPSDIAGVLLNTEPVSGNLPNQADYFEFTLGVETEFDVLVPFDNADIDVGVNPQGTFGYQGSCGFGGASSAHPEHFTCTLPAGTYWLWVNNYDGDNYSYSVLLTVLSTP